MPPYTSSPFNSISVMTPGTPFYVYGGYNDRVAPSKFSISNVVLTSNVATLTVLIREGNIPAVGSLVSVQGTQQASGAFNVTNVALTNVTVDAVTGAGTIAFALTHADVATHSDSGFAIVATPETSEALVNGSSVAVSIPYDSGQPDQGRSVKADVLFPTIPTTATVELQVAVINQDADFISMATVASVAAGVATYAQPTLAAEPGRFYRLKTSGLVGSGTIVGRILS